MYDQHTLPRATACVRQRTRWAAHVRRCPPPRRQDAAASKDSPTANAAGCRALAPTVSKAVTANAHCSRRPCSPARGCCPARSALTFDAISGLLSPRRPVAEGTTSTPNCDGSSRESIRTRACTRAMAAQFLAILMRCVCVCVRVCVCVCVVFYTL